ncbi:MAG TPA: CsgG/HfaB family protein [bacterium]|nr:CsgG/HfaB family protein [bacterium]
MVKRLAAVLTVLTFLILSFAFPDRAHADEKIAVLDFKSILAPTDLGLAVAEILRTELSSLGGYTVIERGMLEQLVQEQALQMSGIVDSETAVKIGKLIGANLVVTGSVVKTGQTYTINSRFVDVETGIIKDGRNIRGSGEDQISAMVHELALIITGKTGESADLPADKDSPTVYMDDFSHGIDTQVWRTESNQRFYTIDDQKGGVRFAKGRKGDNSFQTVGLVFLRQVQGDFDVRIGFRDARIAVLDGAPGNQIELKISFGGQLFIIVYSDEPWLGGHNVHIWADPPRSILGTRKLKVNAGTLRITRKGTLVTGFFNQDVIFSNQFSTEPIDLLSFSLNNNGTKDATSVIFDDFYLSCDRMIP